jgi:hypothetical protein
MFLETKGLEDKMLDHDEIRSIVDNVLGEEKPDDYLLTIETTKFINEEPFTELRFQRRINRDYGVDIPRVGSHSPQGHGEDRKKLFEQLREYAVKHLGIPDIDVTDVHLRYCINGSKGITGIEFTLDVFGDERN